MRTRRRNSPDVAISQNMDESTAILEALNLINAKDLVTSSDVVVLTPNWVKKSVPESGIVVGNESLKTVIQFIKDKNPKRIVVASGSGGNETMDSVKEAAFDEVMKNEGVEFIDLNHGPFVKVSLNHSKPNTTTLNRLYEEMTLLISFTQLKVHEEATLSAAIKNIALSWPPSDEHGHPKKDRGIHDMLHGFITAMAELMPIDLSIVSANPAMIGTGPAKGLPKHTGLVLAGTDPVSVDTIGARLLGLKPQGVHYLFDAGNKGIGISDVLRMKMYGMALIDAEREFTQKVYGTPIAVDAD